LPVPSSESLCLLSQTACIRFSVKNIIKTKWKKLSEKGVDDRACMTFDSKGTNDLKEGTGKLLHPKIAVVVATSFYMLLIITQT